MNAPEQLCAWDRLSRPPKEALKQINAGRLRGMSDVNPQWRYKAMHDVYGPCGIGWKFEISKTWTERGVNDVVFQFAEVLVYVNTGSEWSSPIPGVGGSQLVAKESGGMHNNDEALKMAVTDALSVSLKMLGVAADIYMGRWDGSKYKDPVDTKGPHKSVAKETLEKLGEEEQTYLKGLAMDVLSKLPDEPAMWRRYEEIKMSLDSDEQVAWWSFFDSKSRAALKRGMPSPQEDGGA